MKKKTVFLLNNTSFLFVAAVVVLIMSGVLFATQSSFFTVRDIKIEGLETINSEEITELLGLVQGENLFLLDTDALSHKVQLHPLVAEAGFERQLPHTLVVRVEERSPLALVLMKEMLYEIDGSGTVLRSFDMWPEADCPVLTGVQVEDSAGPGSQIQDAALDKALKCLFAMPEDLKAQVDEVHVEPTGSVKLYLDSHVEVRMGVSDDYAGNLLLLDELIKDERVVLAQARYIDLTSGKPAIGYKDS